MSETTVFQSGNSQAVRLPKEFRFKSKTVEIFRRGDEVVLREKPRTMADVLASLPPVTPEMESEIDEMMAAIRQPLPPDERDWESLFGDAPPELKADQAAIEEHRAPPEKPSKARRRQP